MVDENGTVWAASAGPGGQNGQGFYSYDGTRWKNYNIATMPQLKTNQFFNVPLGQIIRNGLVHGGGGVALVNSAGNLVRVFDRQESWFCRDDKPNYVVIGNVHMINAGNVWVPDYRPLDGNILWEMKPDSSWDIRPVAGEHFISTALSALRLTAMGRNGLSIACSDLNHSHRSLYLL